MILKGKITMSQLTRRQQARRESILEAVRTQLSADGYEGLSMRTIAATAGVSASTLYEIYSSKENLILHAVRNLLEELAVKEVQSESGLARFISRLEAIATLFVASPAAAEALCQLLFQQSQESTAREVLLLNAISARKSSILEMQSTKELRTDIDVDFYARSLVSATWGTALLWTKEVVPLSDFRNELVRLSFTILLPAATKKNRSSILELIAA
jgi:AcrR family transcriptional regulator